MTVTALSHAPDPGKPAAGATGEKAPKSRKKLLVALVAVLAIGGGGYWFVLKPAPSGAPVPGTVVPLEPIQVNLAGGHYLKIGVALQLVEGAETVDGSKALDAVIDEFSGLPMDRLARPGERSRLKKKLTTELTDRYQDDVMGVYFTDFVTQ